MTYPFQKKKKRERERRKESRQGEEQKKELVHSFDLVDGKLYIFFYFLKDKTAEGN